MRKLLRLEMAVVAALAVVSFGAGLLAQNNFGKPRSVIHVVTVDWKEGATPAQIKAALDGVEKMAAAYPGIKNVWLRSIKVQGKSHAFVMEFASEQALKEYTDSNAQLEWYKTYIPIRQESATHDITN